MRDALPEDEDKRLEILFRRAQQPIADDGFSAAVTARLARRTWNRRVVLTIAGAAALAVAIVPAWEIAVLLSRELAGLGARWAGISALLHSPVALAAGFLAVAAPGLWQWLEE